MQFGKFEEKAMEFLKENDIFIPIDASTPIDGRGSLFTVHVLSSYKVKKLTFQTSSFMFEVTSDDLEDLFDKAFRVLKSYGPKATRTKSENTVENKGEQE
jgi:hypothetical protein